MAVFAGCLVGFTMLSSTCGEAKPRAAARDAGAAEAGSAASAAASAEPGVAAGLSAPIAGVRVGGGDVVVAALDVAAHAIRAQRVAPSGAVVADRVVLDDVAWTSDADLKVFAANGGVAIAWHGLRGGALVRVLVTTAPDLSPRGAPVAISAGTCATQDAFYSTDGRRVTARPWTGGSSRADLPEDADASLVCAAHRAFVVLEEEEKTSLLTPFADAGAARTVLVEEAAFGEDDQRERAEYTVGDDLGIVRLGTTGSLAMRELRAGELGAMQKLTITIPREDDVVAVDASARFVVVVSTHDASERCDDGAAATKVAALRIDRATHAEAAFELSPGTCGREIGPFFTGAVGDAVSVAWVERRSVHAKDEAPVAGLVYRAVGPEGAAPELGRIDQPADALVDAGCDEARCYAVALARRPGADVMVPGFARVLRYP